ncbi:alpha/beta hydrolase [Parabacteroides sp. FAFU027]|uniref:alpha/beta hydrolase n=1 Tax=Parabacteroides sp. FAFU027 TaxID=2922715 RepID=UPI001FAF8A96|nr:alpha/beta fold hydrolase [Parabacteroides sp. FAFU027]
MKFTIILIASLLFVSNAYSLKPDTTAYLITPSRYGLMYKEYKVKTKDGYTLNAWFCPAQTAPSIDSLFGEGAKEPLQRPYVIDNAKRPTIIICNGDAGNMYPNVSLAYRYCQYGFNVITFDWRGFGQSQYFPINTDYLVYPEFITDYNAIVDFAKQIPIVDSNRIGVFGYSTGAFLSFAIASQRPEIKAIVARGIFTDYKSVTPGLQKLVPKRTLFCPEGMDKYSPRNNWSTFRKPIFLVVGEKDIRTPKENSIEILSNVKSNVRELWIVEKAEHGSDKAPEIVEHELFIKKTVCFFKDNL